MNKTTVCRPHVQCASETEFELRLRKNDDHLPLLSPSILKLSNLPIRVTTQAGFGLPSVGTGMTGGAQAYKVSYRRKCDRGRCPITWGIEVLE